jgi:hypothetical protein
MAPPPFSSLPILLRSTCFARKTLSSAVKLTYSAGLLCFLPTTRVYPHHTRTSLKLALGVLFRAVNHIPLAPKPHVCSPKCGMLSLMLALHRIAKYEEL